MQSVKARFLPFSLHNGYENMATDEYLVAWQERERRPVLRIYGWARPCISLGRYQRSDCLDLEACRRDGVGIVRRMTGGGAIFHDCEVTYSLATSDANLEGRPLPIEESFARLNRFILDTYHSLGLPAAYAKDASPQHCPGRRAPFCFSGREAYDVIIRGKKIGGNAQCRTRGVIFQHGSIPLAIDGDRAQKYFQDRIDAQMFTSLGALLGGVIAPEEVAVRLAQAFVKNMGLELCVTELTAAEQMEIDLLMRQKYLHDAWNLEGRLETHEVRQAGLAKGAGINGISDNKD